MSTFELYALCDREKPLWPPGRVFKHSCAVSCDLAPAAVLSILPSHTQHRHQATSDTKTPVSVLQHEVLLLNAFLREPCPSSLHITVTSWNKIMPLVPTGHFISGAAFAPPPSPQPHPPLTAAERGEDKSLPKSLSAPATFFYPLEAAEL